MIKIKTLLLSALVVSALASCKKETETVTVEKEPTPSLIGAWDGYYGSRSINGSDTLFTNPSNGYSMVLQSGGSAIIYDAALKDTTGGSRAVGSWIYSTNNTIVVDYKYINGGSRYIIRAKIDPKLRAMNGKYHNGTDNSVGGLFYMVKQ